MDDYKSLIYVALSIIYFIARGIGKKNKNKIPQNSEQTSKSPSTFEQILAELTGSEMKQEQEARKTVSDEYEAASTTMPDDGNSRTSRSIEGYNAAEHDDTLKELYEKGEKLKTLNELVEIDSIETKSHFKAYSVDEETNDLASEIRSDFNNPDTVKKAFIYSEIFKRKY